MNISQILKNNNSSNNNTTYIGPFKRGFASLIDVILVLLLRSFTAQILGLLYINNAWIDFNTRFSEHFGTDIVKNTKEHAEFIVNDKIFMIMLSFMAFIIIIGALYYAILNSSAWQTTIGNRVMNIIMTKENGSKITFGLALWHYILSILPFVFIVYLVSYQQAHQITFFQAVTASYFNLLFGVLFVAWVQIQAITKKKTTAYDMICQTLLVKGKTAAKFPWSKVS